MSVDPAHRAFHRDLDGRLASSLQVARIDQRSLRPETIARAEWMEGPTDYLGTVCWLLSDATYERYRDIEREAAAAGDPPERTLSDFAGGDA